MQIRTLLLLPTVALGAALAAPALAGDSSSAPGAVYTSTNEAAGNRVALFARGTDGALGAPAFVATGGLGTGMGLGNQGAVVLSDDQRFLYVVNAGSDDLTVFAVQEFGLSLVQRVPTGGDAPISVTQHDDLVYVVHAGSSSIAGFRQDFDGTLTLMPRSQRRLTGQMSGPAQISFDPAGENLYVTLKPLNLIDHFAVDDKGFPSDPSPIASNGMTPFGFGFGKRGQLFVSEAFGGMDGLSTVSSYGVQASGDLQTISPSVPSLETAVCWIVVAPGGRFLYASNTGTATVSSYAAGFDGTLSLVDADAANTGEGPVDMALTPDGDYFYVLNGAAGSVGDYAVEADGSLTGLPGSAASGLPAGASGLAAR